MIEKKTEHKKSKVTLKAKLAALIAITCFLQLMFTTSGYLFVYGSLDRSARNNLYETFQVVSGYSEDLASYIQTASRLIDEKVDIDLVIQNFIGNPTSQTGNELITLTGLITLSVANTQIGDLGLYIPSARTLISEINGVQRANDLSEYNPVRVYESLKLENPLFKRGDHYWATAGDTIYYMTKTGSRVDAYLFVELVANPFGKLSSASIDDTHTIILMQGDRVLMTSGSALADSLPLTYWAQRGAVDQDITIGSTKYYIRSAANGALDYRLVYLVPKSSYYSEITEFFILSGITLLINISVWVFFANSLIIKTVYGPVMELVKSLEGVKNNEFGVIMEEFNEREWDEVTTAFNTMVQRINDNVKQMYQKDLLMKDIELKFLQSQINPHFLYNTLDTIASKASSGDIVDVNRITGYLSRMYRLVFNRGNDFLPCKDVMLCSEMYFKLCEFKYSNFRYKLKLDPQIADKPVLNLIVQTVAENAMVHGYDSSKPHFMVYIRGYSFEDKIIFEVIDNGKGFNEDQLNTITKIMQKENIRSESGLVNTQKRLKLYYGPECGIQIKSRRGRYTKVTITMLADLPKRYINDEEEEE